MMPTNHDFTQTRSKSTMRNMMVPRVLNVDRYMYVPHSSMCRSFSMAHNTTDPTRGTAAADVHS